MVRRGESAGKDGRRGVADESAGKGVRVHADSEHNRRRIAQPRWRPLLGAEVHCPATGRVRPPARPHPPLGDRCRQRADHQMRQPPW